jgi:hypothetical protein
MKQQNLMSRSVHSSVWNCVAGSCEWEGCGSLRGARRGVVVGVDHFVMSPATVNQERKNDIQNSLSQVG